jgi:oxygen-independent coproporphyrinogen-3 oxidase
MIAALLKEIDLRHTYLENELVETIYFGGGTPSLLSGQEINNIIGHIRLLHQVSGDAEITLEANPDDITEEKLIAWNQAGINRLSIGVQSFFEEDLIWMNRAHNASQATDALELALKYFPNITIDLIYGTPALTNEKWKQNVEQALKLNVPHLSCYALTVEPKTPLDKMIRQHQSPEVEPAQQAEQFRLLMDWLEQAGYEHYEISNFAKPGMRSRHNSSYWASAQSAKGKKYLGIGPSAHSFDGISRQWNIANNSKYISAINGGSIPSEREELTSTQQLNEYIMTALRTSEGINLDILQSAFSINSTAFHAKAKKFSDSGLLTTVENSVRLTKEGKLLADGIASDLFY